MTTMSTVAVGGVRQPHRQLVVAGCESVTFSGRETGGVAEIRAVAIGGITRKIATLALGQVASYAGFIAPSRNAKGLVFHVTEVDA